MKYKLKAIIVKSGRVISVSTNSVLPYVIGAQKGSKELWNANSCAEKGAILKALKMQDGLKHLAGSVIYVTRFSKSGATRLAKPCKHCEEFIRSVGIKKVVYTTDTGTQELKL